MIKRVFVSFDYDLDKQYKYLLNAWDANSSIDFTFTDRTSDEIQSDSVPVVKAALSRRINTCTYMLVIIGRDANRFHDDFLQIGYCNWQNYEIACAKKAGLKIVGVKLDHSYESPNEILGANAKWAMSFTMEAITRALNLA